MDLLLVLISIFLAIVSIILAIVGIKLSNAQGETRENFNQIKGILTIIEVENAKLNTKFDVVFIPLAKTVNGLALQNSKNVHAILKNKNNNDLHALLEYKKITDFIKLIDSLREKAEKEPSAVAIIQQLLGIDPESNKILDGKEENNEPNKQYGMGVVKPGTSASALRGV